MVCLSLKATQLRNKKHAKIAFCNPEELHHCKSSLNSTVVNSFWNQACIRMD